jgi:hypothetical protein
MADLENVIKEFETGIQDFSPADTSDERFKEVCNAVLTLLKAQEPRVMDADEIVLSADPSKWLWVERKGDYCAEAFKAGKTIRGLIYFDSETPGAFLDCEHPDEYGKTWRCWTSRPTDEQREAVKWDG